jgi:hypothetical protein
VRLTPLAVTTDLCVLGPGLPDEPVQLARDCVVRVVDTSSAPGFWDVNFGTFTPFLAAVVALVGVWLTLRQRGRMDRSDELWKRMSWALDHASSSEQARQLTGLRGLNQFVRSSRSPSGAPERKPDNTLWGSQGSRFTLSPADIELLEGVARSALDATMTRRQQNGGDRG